MCSLTNAAARLLVASFLAAPGLTGAVPAQERSDDEGAADVTTLVSNLGQELGKRALLSNRKAQGFTTGSNAHGYTVSSIDLFSVDQHGDAFSASIYTADAEDFPGTLVADFIPPASFPWGRATFTAPADTVLAADTDYFVVVRPGSDITWGVHLGATFEHAEDSGAASGWSISNAYLYKTYTGWLPSNSSPTRPLYVGVSGTPIPNHSPVFSLASVVLSIAENTPADQGVGSPVTATDANNDPLVYSLTGADAAAFAVDSGSGQIRTRDPLDFETRATYQFEIRADDGFGGTASASVRVDVTDVVETVILPPPQRPGPGGGGGGGSPPEEEEPEPEPEPEPSGPPVAAFTVDAECADGLCRALTGVAVRFTSTSTGAVGSLVWDFAAGARRRGSAVSHAWTEPGFYEVSLTAAGGGEESTASMTFLVEAATPAGTLRRRPAHPLPRGLPLRRHGGLVDRRGRPQ